MPSGRRRGFDWVAVRQRYLADALSLLDDAEWVKRQGRRFDRAKHVAWAEGYADAQVRREKTERERMGLDEPPSEPPPDFLSGSQGHH